MTNKEFTRIKRELKPFQRLFLTVACLGLLSSCGGSGSGGGADTATAQDVTKQIAAVSVPESWASRVPEKTIMRTGANGLPLYREKNEFENYHGVKVVKREILITVKDGVSINELKNAISAIGWKVVSNYGVSYQLDVSASSDDLDTIIEKAKKIDCIETSSLNFLMTLNSLATPTNDPLVNSNTQWHVLEPRFDLAWKAIQDLPANSINVGIVDAGIRFNHEDLPISAIVTPNQIIASGYSKALCLSTDGKVANEDSLPCRNANHGMNVAGIIAATGNNGVGSVGVAFGRASIFGFRVNQVTSGSISNGVKYLIENGAKVINLSMGLNVCPFSEQEGKIVPIDLPEKIYVDYVENFIKDISEPLKNNSEVVFVQAAGNNGDCALSDNRKIYSWRSANFATNSHPRIRAKLSESIRSIADIVAERTIIVGAYSSGRKFTSYTTEVEDKKAADYYIVAPGGSGGYFYVGKEGGLDKTNIPGPSYIENNIYISIGGTSQAAPHVSGLAALVWSANSSLKAKEVRDVIISTADNSLGNPYETNKSESGIDGYRYLNAEAAVKEALARKKSFSDDFNGTSIDSTKWTTLPLGYQPGNIASFSVSGGSLHISTNGGSNGYLGIADGGRIRPKGVVLDGDFTIVADITEIMRGYNGYANRSCAMLWMHDAAADINSTSSQKAMVSICGDSTNGGVADRSILGWSGDAIAFQDPLVAGKYYQVEMRIRRAAGKIYLGYRMAGSLTWKEVASTGTPVAMSLVPEILVWSGDGGGTRVNGSFAADINSVLITAP